jgi:hypothetical protein
MRKTSLFLAAALIMAPGIAQAAAPAPCLTAREFTDLSAYALPSIITGTAQRCSAALGPDAYLKRSGPALSSRYAAGKPAAWPGAKLAFLKLSGGDAANLLRDMPDDKLQPLADALVEGLIGQQIPTERCRTVDTFVRLLAPLPPRNFAELIAVAAGLGSQTGGGRVGRIAICSA